MICVKIMWFDRDKETGDPIYDNPRYKEFIEETPEKCWSAVKDFKWNHDILRHTIPEVVDIKTV